MAAVVAALPAQVQPGLQFAELGKQHLPADSERDSAVAYGDVDGDGDLDLVLGTPYYHQSRLYLNNGTGAFADATASQMPVGNYDTWSVALGDVDGDGDLDLVLGNRNQQNRLYLNNGAGTFSDATAGRMPTVWGFTWSVALGDVDSDGDLDMVLGDYGQQNQLFLNNGTGTFANATASRMPADSDRTGSVALGDVDGDGDVDMVLGNGGQNRLYLNNGTGTFSDATASRMPADNDDTKAVALGDVDGDGDLDMVIGNFGLARLYLNNGTGTFADATGSRLPRVSDDTTSVALGDVDGDGDLDIALGNGRQDRLYLNNGTGTFSDATAGRFPLVLGNSTSVALGDLDGDGDRDMVIGNTDLQQNRLYLNNGTGAFSDATANRLPAVPDYTNSVALGDVDGDGDLDMVLANGSALYWRQNRLYRNNGAGTFSDATASRMPVLADNTASVALGDVDGDGDLDMVLGSQLDRLYRNNGTGTFSDATAGRMPVDNEFTTSVALGDVDGDGDLDLVLGNSGYRQNRLYRNDGTGTFSDATAGRMPVLADNTLAVALGDLDGDGDLDMVTGNGGWQQQDRLYLNNGTGTFSNATAGRLPLAPGDTASVQLGDLDGDGDLDLVVGKWQEQNRLYLNNGTATFSDATAIRLPVLSDQTRSVALGDLDGDGDLDLAIANNRQQNRLYTNLQRQLDAPHLLRIGQPYTLDVYSRYVPPGQFDLAFPYLSTTRASIALPPYGVLRIDPIAPLPLVLIQQPAGVGRVTWTLPNNPAFVGIEIFAQALSLQSPTEIHLTNVTADVILR